MEPPRAQRAQRFSRFLPSMPLCILFLCVLRVLCGKKGPYLPGEVGRRLTDQFFSQRHRSHGVLGVPVGADGISPFLADRRAADDDLDLVADACFL